MIIFYTE